MVDQHPRFATVDGGGIAMLTVERVFVRTLWLGKCGEGVSVSGPVG